MMVTLAIAVDLWYLAYDSDYGAEPAKLQLRCDVSPRWTFGTVSMMVILERSLPALIGYKRWIPEV
jgi:hypothetical protein